MERMRHVTVEYLWTSPELLHIRYIDFISGDELVNSALSLSGESRLDNTCYIIGDWRETQSLKILPEDVSLLVSCLRSISKICPNAKNASIVNRDKSGNALVAWYKLLCEDLSWEVEIFHSLDDAMAWFSL